jgi:hypothetical protein
MRCRANMRLQYDHPIVIAFVQPVMTNVHGWHTRTSKSIDGPTRFALKSRRNQQRKQVKFCLLQR